MGRREAIVALLLAVLAPAVATRAQVKAPAPPSDEFSFYGLRFGMVREEVKALKRTNPEATEVVDPGHGMTTLYLGYDFVGRLSEIRASYERPAEKMRELALRQALRERFQQPIGQRWRSISCEVDEYFNRAALTLVLVATELRQQELDHYKDQYLKGME